MNFSNDDNDNEIGIESRKDFVIKHSEDLFRFSMEYGHGVFTVNMIHLEERRISLRMFIKRNPGLFVAFQGGPGSLCVYSLTKEAYRRFRGSGAPTSTPTRSMTYDAHLDMALINAFMIQNNLASHYSYGPHFKMRCEGKIFGFYSTRWGMPKYLDQIDALILRKEQYKILTSSPLESLCKKFGISEIHLKNIFKNSCFPLQ